MFSNFFPKLYRCSCLALENSFMVHGWAIVVYRHFYFTKNSTSVTELCNMNCSAACVCLCRLHGWLLQYCAVIVITVNIILLPSHENLENKHVLLIDYLWGTQKMCKCDLSYSFTWMPFLHGALTHFWVSIIKLWVIVTLLIDLFYIIDSASTIKTMASIIKRLKSSYWLCCVKICVTLTE